MGEKTCPVFMVSQQAARRQMLDGARSAEEGGGLGSGSCERKDWLPEQKTEIMGMAILISSTRHVNPFFLP